MILADPAPLYLLRRNTDAHAKTDMAINLLPDAAPLPASFLYKLSLREEAALKEELAAGQASGKTVPSAPLAGCPVMLKVLILFACVSTIVA